MRQPHKNIGAAPGDPGAARAVALFVPGSELDGVDPQGGVGLPMTLRAAVMLPLLVLEDADLAVASLTDDGADDQGLVDEGRAEPGLSLLAASDEQDLTEGDLLADGGGEALQVDRVALLHPVLLAAGPDDRVHRSLLQPTPPEHKTLGRPHVARQCTCCGWNKARKPF